MQYNVFNNGFASVSIKQNKRKQKKIMLCCHFPERIHQRPSKNQILTAIGDTLFACKIYRPYDGYVSSLLV